MNTEQERRDFEALERKRKGFGSDTLARATIEPDDEYLLPLVQARWEGYQAGRADRQRRQSEAEEVCAEAYQVVGSLLSDLGIFETERAEKILDNLSQAKMVHSDVLPWGSIDRQRRGGQRVWKPIGTAPEEGCWALVCGDGAMDCMFIKKGQAPENWTKPANPNLWPDYVTHWMPIPAFHAEPCATCSDNGAVGNILNAEPCPDCTAPATLAAEPVKVPSDDDIEMLWSDIDTKGLPLGKAVPLFARAIERAVLQSPEVQAWKRDAERYHEIRSRLTGQAYDPRYFEDLFIAGCMGHPDVVDGEVDAAKERQT